MKDKTLLIDGDVIAFQASASCEKPIDWGDGLWTIHAFEQEVEEVIQSKMDMICETMETDNVIVALSWPTNFRYDIFPEYKANRKGKRRPMLLEHAKDYMKKTWETFIRPGLEGDDVLGILATSPVVVKAKEKIIVSIDKDMLNIPCQYFDIYPDRMELNHTTEEEAIFNHMKQTLTGDTSDNYKGCKGVGPKTADKILDGVPWTYKDLWPVVLEQFRKKGHTDQEALTMARLARICQRNDYDFKKKKVILWNPPEEG